MKTKVHIYSENIFFFSLSNQSQTCLTTTIIDFNNKLLKTIDNKYQHIYKQISKFGC